MPLDMLEEEEWVTPTVGRWVLLSTVLASSMAFIGQSALNVALPALQADLGATGSQLLWIVNGYTLMLASLILLGGTLGDKLGRKKVFMIGIALFTIASVLCGLAPSTVFLISARVVQGIGGSLMIPGSLAIITASFPPDRRGGAIGTWSAATTITTVAGPVIGGFLAEAGLWRVVFLINVPLAVVSMVVLVFRVSESRNRDAFKKIDFPGAAFATLSLVGLAYGFTSAPDHGFTNPRVFGALGVGVLFLFLFILIEKKSDHPMVPLSLFRSMPFTGANLLTLFLYGALTAYSLFLSLNIIQVQGYRESLAGFAFLPFVLLLAGISRPAGRLVDRIGPRILLIGGPLLVGAGFMLTSFVGLTGGPKDYFTTFLPGIVVFGIGMGFTVAPLTTTVMSSVATRFAGTASGINNATSRVAGVLAIAIIGSAALISFSSGVNGRIDLLNLEPEVRADVMAETRKLGDADVPESVPSDKAVEVSMVLKSSFVDAFRIAMYICAGLSWLSAVMSFLFIGGIGSVGQPRQE